MWDGFIGGVDVAALEEANYNETPCGASRRTKSVHHDEFPLGCLQCNGFQREPNLGKKPKLPAVSCTRQLGFTNREEQSRSDATRLDRKIAQGNTGGWLGKHFGQCRRSKGLFDLSQSLIDPKVERTQIHSV